MTNAAVALLMIWSLANCFFGYRIFRGITAFYSILFITLLAVFLALPLGPLVLLPATIAGILAGWFLRNSMYYVIVFIMGFLVMLGAIMAALSLIAYFAPGISEHIRLLIALGIGLVGGVLAVYVHRPVFIASSAILGSVGTVAGAEYFISRAGSLLAAYESRGPLRLLEDLFSKGNVMLLLIIGTVAAVGILAQCYIERGYRRGHHT